MDVGCHAANSDKIGIKSRRAKILTGQTPFGQLYPKRIFSLLAGNSLYHLQEEMFPCRVNSVEGDRAAWPRRRLYDFRHGARTGEWSPLMVQVVATLDEPDLLAIVAYLASRDP